MYRIHRTTADGRHLGYLHIDKAGIVTLTAAGKATRWGGKAEAEAVAETRQPPQGAVHLVEEAHSGRPRIGVSSAERMRKLRSRGVGREAVAAALFEAFSQSPTSRNSISSLLEKVVDRVHARRQQVIPGALKEETREMVLKVLATR